MKRNDTKEFSTIYPLWILQQSQATQKVCFLHHSFLSGLLRSPSTVGLAVILSGLRMWGEGGCSTGGRGKKRGGRGGRWHHHNFRLVVEPREEFEALHRPLLVSRLVLSRLPLWFPHSVMILSFMFLRVVDFYALLLPCVMENCEKKKLRRKIFLTLI